MERGHHNGQPRETRLRLGPWSINAEAREVSGPVGIVRLEPKAMAVLLELSRTPDEVVSRQQLLDRVWGEEMATDDVLSRAISELRRALGDDTRNPRAIVTVRGTGYRLVLPEAASDAERASPTVARPTTSNSRVGAMATSAALLVLLATVIAVRSTRLARASVAAELRVTPLTTRPGQESAPRLSPDGTRISYAWRDELQRTQRVYVRLVHEESEIPVTPVDGNYQLSAWSPDGVRLAVTRTDSAALGIYELPSLGGSPRLITRVGGPYILGLDWSPDGSRLVYSALDSGTMSFGTRVFDLRTKREQRVTTGARDAFGDVYSTFSPDGQWVAFARFFSEVASDIFVVPAQGGTARRLTQDERPITAITFDTDGRSLLYASNRDGRTAVWRIAVDAADSSPHRVYDASHGISGLAVTPAPSGIVIAEHDQDLNIWTTRADRAEPPKQILASTRLDALPRYSPDNDRIAFVSDRSGASELWVSDRSGAGATRLTHLGDMRGRPSWSPNGEMIAVEREVRGRSELWTVDVARRTATRVPSMSRDAVAPSWSADGRSLYVSSRASGTWELFSVSVSTGAATQLTTGGGMAPRAARDGHSLLFVKPYARGLWQFDLATRVATLVTADVGAGDCTNWDVASNAVYFVKRDGDGRQSIVSFAFAGGPLSVVATDVRVPVGSGGLSVTSDGRTLAYGQVDRRDGDLVVVSVAR